MSVLSRVFFQARSAADAPASGANVYILRRGASVDAGSTNVLIKSKDPGCLVSGDVVRVIRDGDVLTGTGVIELTLLANPDYDITNQEWDISVSFSESWTPANGDRLVLKEDAGSLLNIFEDSEGEVPITQPTTLGSLGTYEAWAEISGYDICISFGGNYEYVTSGVDSLRGFVTPEDFGALGESFPEDTLGWQRAMDFAHSTETKVVRSLAKTYYTEDLKGRIGVHAYGGGYYSNPTIPAESGTVLRPQPTPPGVGVTEAVIAWRGNQGPGADWEDDRLTGFSLNSMKIEGLATDNRPIVLVEDCSLFNFNDLWIENGGRNAIRLLGCWDARFNNILFGTCGSSDGLYPAVYMGNSASLADTNNLYFNDCVFGYYRGAAIGIEGSPNEIVFANVKVESTISAKTDIWIRNGSNIRFDGLQITGLVDKPTEHLISLDNCNNCYGDIHVEHVGSVTCDHYVQVNANCNWNKLDVVSYGFDNSLNGIVGDDNSDRNYIQVIPVSAPTVEHPIYNHPPAVINRFATQAESTKIKLEREDYPPDWTLGNLVQDGATAYSKYEFKAGTNLIYAVDRLGNITFGADVNINSGTILGTYLPDEVYNVKNYGALGNNSADDTAAIQACINAAFAHPRGGGAVVYFPPGYYRIASGPLVVDYSSDTGFEQLTILGAGRLQSRLLLVASGAENLLEVNCYNGATRGIRIISMGFSRSSGTGGSGIEILNPVRSLIDDCYVQGFSGGHGIVLDVEDSRASYFNIIQNTQVGGNVDGIRLARTGISGAYNSGNMIHGCTLTGNSGFDLNLVSEIGGTFVSNTFIQPQTGGSHGINLGPVSSSGSNKFSNIHIDADSSTNVITIDASHQYNFFTNVVADGALADSSGKSEFLGCYFSAAAMSGIRNYITSLKLNGTGDIDMNNRSLINSGSEVYVKMKNHWGKVEIPLTAGYSSAATPSWEAVNGGVFAWHYLAASDAILQFALDIPPSYVEGTSLEPFVKWIGNNTDTGNVRWKFEYLLVNIDGTVGSTVVDTLDLPSDGVVGRMQVHEFTSISGSGINVGATLICALTREGSHANDTYTGKCAAISFGISLRVNSIGSDSEFAKT